MKIIYGNNGKEYARGVELRTGINWVIYCGKDYQGSFEIPDNFKKILDEIRKHLNDGAKKHNLNIVWKEQRVNILERTITTDLLENEIEDQVRKILGDFEAELNKKYANKFLIEIKYVNDVCVDVEEINPPKTQASKEIKEVLTELNRIYAGCYKFNYTEDKK